MSPFFVTHAAAALRAECLRQLHAEVVADQRTGASVPPLPPAGWTMEHRPASSTFVMKRTVFAADIDCRWASADFPMAPPPEGTSPQSPARLQHRPSAVAEYANVSVWGRFDCRDWSLADPAVDICEWIPFDVVVECQGSRSVLVASLAHVNSQLRLRHLSFAPRTLGASEELTPLRVFQRERTLYRGPNINGLSKELNEVIVGYLHSLGVDGHLAECVAQTAHFLEQEEYSAYLARLADTVAPPDEAR